MDRSRRALQIVTGILGVIPVATGLVGLLGLRDPLYVRFGVVPNVVLDSNLRFFGGVWLGLGGLVPRQAMDLAGDLPSALRTIVTQLLARGCRGQRLYNLTRQ